MQKKSGIKNHVNRRSRILAIMLVLSMMTMLTACGNRNDSSAADALKKKLEDSKQDVKETETGTQTEEATDEKVPDEEAEAADPGVENFKQVYIKDRYESESDENRDHNTYINYNYELIDLGKEDAMQYPELAKKLLVVNDLIATEEANCHTASMQEYQSLNEKQKDDAFENYELPFKEDWKIYKRRADSAIFSILTEHVNYSGMDYNQIHYVGYNFDPVSGEELKLSDVIEDEDAFIKVLAKKAQDIMQSELPDEIEYEEEGVSATIRENLDMDMRGNWTLDPEGVSVWFDSYTLLPTGMHLNVLFADDPDGEIFKGSYRDETPESWTMYLPLCTAESFISENGTSIDTVTVGESYAYYGDDNEYEYVDGIMVLFNDSEEKFEMGDEIYETGTALVHKNQKTFLLVGYREYDWSFLDTYTFFGGKVKKACGIDGSVSSIPYEELDEDDHSIPDCLLSDPTHIPISTYTDMLSTCASEKHYNLEDDGTLQPEEDYYTIQKDSQYKITAKYNLSGLHVVDEQTHEAEPDTVDLKKGDTFTMEYTDNESYVDGRIKDGTMIRIPIEQDKNEGGRYLQTDEGKVDIWDSFEDMFFAG